jgi:hypothetical protein
LDEVPEEEGLSLSEEPDLLSAAGFEPRFPMAILESKSGRSEKENERFSRNLYEKLTERCMRLVIV